MKFTNILIIIFLILISSSSISGLSINDNKNNIQYYKGYSVDGNKITFGVATYLRYDGVIRPTVEQNILTGEWPYLITEYPNYYDVSRMNRSIKLPKKSWITWEFKATTIRPTPIKVNNLAELASITKPFNSTVRYLDISELVGSPEYLGKLIKIGDFTWDSKLDIYDTGIEVYDYNLNETYFNRSYAPKNSYKFKVINNKIRLYANIDRKSTRLNSSHTDISRMPSSA